MHKASSRQKGDKYFQVSPSINISCEQDHPHFCDVGKINGPAISITSISNMAASLALFSAAMRFSLYSKRLKSFALDLFAKNILNAFS